MTREEFLNEYKSSYPTWADKADAADLKEPSKDKIKQGWVIEQPAHSTFNWHQNRTDKRLAGLEARVAWLEKLAGIE